MIVITQTSAQLNGAASHVFGASFSHGAEAPSVQPPSGAARAEAQSEEDSSTQPSLQLPAQAEGAAQILQAAEVSDSNSMHTASAPVIGPQQTANPADESPTLAPALGSGVGGSQQSVVDQVSPVDSVVVAAEDDEPAARETSDAARSGAGSEEEGERGGSVPPDEAAAGVPDADVRPRGRDVGSADESDLQPPAKRPALDVEHSRIPPVIGPSASPV